MFQGADGWRGDALLPKWEILSRTREAEDQVVVRSRDNAPAVNQSRSNGNGFRLPVSSSSKETDEQKQNDGTNRCRDDIAHRGRRAKPEPGH